MRLVPRQVSLVVIIFELTDGIDYIMPTTICILVRFSAFSF
jgi:hypothetical protein